METDGSGLLLFETVKGVSSFPQSSWGFGLVSDGEYALKFSNFHPRPGRGLAICYLLFAIFLFATKLPSLNEQRAAA